MKPAFILVVFLAFINTCYAFVAPMSEEERIRTCDFIIVATIEGVEPVKQKKELRYYRQRATAKIERCIKGELNGTVEIYGGENFICAQTRYKPGRYLLFLRKHNDILTSAGVRSIINDTVEWHQNGENVSTSSNRPLDQVVDEIRQLLDLYSKLKGNRAWEFLSNNGTRFRTPYDSYPLNEAEFAQLYNLGCLSKIRDLNFCESGPTVNTILHYFKDSPIERLYFFEGDVSDDALAALLDHLPLLKELSLDQVRCGTGFLCHINSPFLEKLDIDFSTVIEGTFCSITNFPNLQSLQLPESMTNEEFIHLTQLTNLTMLTIRGDRRNGQVFACIQHLPLTRLNVYGDFPDDAMKPIGKITTLEHLEIINKKFGNDGVLNLTNLPSLSHLDIISPLVSDESMKYINQLALLTHISLYNTGITDDGLAQITNLPALRWIRVANTGVTDQGIDDFRKRFPNVYVNP